MRIISLLSPLCCFCCYALYAYKITNFNSFLPQLDLNYASPRSIQLFQNLKHAFNGVKTRVKRGKLVNATGVRIKNALCCKI